ncbi:nitronate monooxygenase [Paenarthrobacter sp. NPDC089316]|uniref:NAD(P)H-dependent flavin oxidoreductase n=1 Tax=unclassified Paenarthrobacter TaxID=2634190 RepID=UPI00342A782D
MSDHHEARRVLQANGLLASLGATIPLVAAPMAGGPSTTGLVLATARAGGVGFLAGGYKTPAELAGQIAEVRSGTSSFGVNLFVPNTVPINRDAFIGYAQALRTVAAAYGVDLRDSAALEDSDRWDDKVDMLAHDPVPVVSFTFGLPPADVVRRLKQAGTLVLQTVTNPEEAKRAAALGVDGLIVQSHRAGGHSGTMSPGTPIAEVPMAGLLDSVRTTTHLPLWAAGGIATPAAVQEALGAGAEAAVIGTVLLRTPESGASATYKKALADPARTETLLTTAFSGRPARALRNRFLDQFHTLAPAGYPALHHLTSPLRKAAAAAGDPEGINIWAGTGYKHATDEPAANILLRLAEAR